jgi:cell division septation protein DedD
VAAHTHDDGFHEIQLNGKQLVFLFMAVTVVSVVIFLCGVLVGRGVRAERVSSAADASAIAPATTPDAPRPQAPPVPAGSDPTKAAAPAPAEDGLTYFGRLDKKNPPAEELKTADKAPVASKASADKAPAPAKASVDKAEKSAEKTAPAKRPAAAPPKEARAEEAVSAEPAGGGFALQITALKEAGEAEAVARRLSAKGYSAYVLRPAEGSPSVYRVRVGKFKTRREAEAMATKLNKEEQFTPWITR